MDRRNFVKASSLGAFALTLPLQRNDQSLTLRPGRLAKGSKVGLVAPASALSRSAFEQTLENIQSLDFEVTYTDNLRVRSGFLSGTDEQRANDLHQMFMDDSVEGIICARGGYGSGRLLPLLDFDIIRANPKVLLGFSDITALHQAIYHNTGLITFHGPVGASTFNDFTRDYLEDVCMKGKRVKIKPDDVDIIFEGSTAGKLIGGNLSLLASQVGTPYQPSYRDHILFIEEIGESTYRVDRMLTQLKQSKALDGVKGILLGYFTNCDAKPGDPGYETSLGLREVFVDQFESLNIPVMAGFPFGHEAHNITLPIGCMATMDTQKGKLQLTESAVS